MLAAEQQLIDQGTSIGALMEQAGQGAAQEIWRISGDIPTLVLCGPGNNGGDGYVIAEWLRLKGVPVAVASMSEPKTNASKNASNLWHGPTFSIEIAEPRQQIVDCIFGTGLQRPVSGDLLDQYLRLCRGASKRVAVDVPSGVDSNTGRLLSEIPDFDLTIALGAYKPSHFLAPARSKMGHVVGVNIDVSSKSNVRVMERPIIGVPNSDDHKYTRGLVTIIAGKMHGAAKLSALAAQCSGAGYVKILAPPDFNSPESSIVVETCHNSDKLTELLDDDRIGVVAIGPGLARDDEAANILMQVLETNHKLVLDADALTVLGASFAERIRDRKQETIATPHAGEFANVFKEITSCKLEDARALACDARATILYKGSDTVIAAPDSNALVSNTANPWLSTAGTGDVLTGIIAARSCHRR